ncbi:MAG: hypothetical protein HY231_07050 [Acidobacteria bacterium]|nr:hypothetical protein [Acidobacteriota bacterium]
MMAPILPQGLQRAGARSPITYSKVLLVEGQTPFQFFKALLKNLGLDNQIEIRNFGGVRDVAAFLKALVGTDGFDQVLSLGLVRDAEENALSAFDSVTDCLKRASLNSPSTPAARSQGTPVISIFILPDNTQSGMLETLYLQAVSNDSAMKCIDEFFDCLSGKGVQLPDNLDKARIQTYLASREKSGLLLGQAAHAGYLFWGHPAFDSLKQFLLSL